MTTAHKGADAPRIALVTGGSSGIGKATVEQLAASGYTVVIGYNARREKAEQLAGEIAGKGHVALHIAIDDAGSIAQAVSAVEAGFGRLDVLVNNGGATQTVPAGDFDALTDEIFDRMAALNLRGPFSVVRAFRGLLSVPEASVIVNVSSIAARTGVGSNLAYCAAKAGLDALTVGMAKVLAPKTRVFSVSPAGVDTDFVIGRKREQLEALAQSLPLAKLTQPEDVARAILACITHLTSSTGIVLPVDEGRSI